MNRRFRTTSASGRSLGGFTLIEILAVVAVLAILVALLLPALKGMLSRAADAKCVSNLRALSAASILFSTDNNGKWPLNSVGTPRGVFANDLIPYLEPIPGRQDANFRNSPLICPTMPKDGVDSNYRFQGVYTPSSYRYEDPDKTVRYGIGYAQNIYAADRAQAYYVKNRLAVGKTSSFMLYMDFSNHYVTSSSRLFNVEKEALKKRHNNKLNIAFADGSIRAIPYEEIPPQTPRLGPGTASFWYGLVEEN